MMQQAITPDRKSLTGVQDVEGAAVGHKARLVQGDEVGGEGCGGGHVGQGLWDVVQEHGVDTSLKPVISVSVFINDHWLV